MGAGVSRARRHPGAWALAAVAGSLLAVVAVLALAQGRSPSLDERVQDVAGDLRCPSCDGESAAQSNAPMARSMRAEIRSQLSAGRSPDQVRAWFQERYGAGVVLSPGGGGLGWLLWATPVVLLAGGVGLVLLRRRSAGSPEPAGPRREPAPLGAAHLAVTAGLVATVAIAVPSLVAAHDRAGGAASAEAASDTSATSEAASSVPQVVLSAQRLDAAGRYEQAVPLWRRAHRRYPQSAGVSTRLAFDLLRVGQAAQAPPLVRAAARRPGGQRAMALLVLGLAQRDLGRPEATSTLRTFLTVAPDHPAAGQVRRLLGQA